MVPPLYIAAAEGEISIVEMILKAGADLSRPGNQLAICPAVMLDHGNVLMLFLDLGMNVNPDPKCDLNTRSPLRLARDAGNQVAERRLVRAGAKEDY